MVLIVNIPPQTDSPEAHLVSLMTVPAAGTSGSLMTALQTPEVAGLIASDGGEGA